MPTSRLRILAISPTFLPVQGGAERLLDQVLRRLAVHHDITLLTAQPPARLVGSSRVPPVAPATARTPFAVYRYVDKWSMERLRGRRWHQGFAPPFSLSASLAAVRLARALRPDVIHVHYAIPTGLAGLLAAWTARAPWVLSFVGRDIPGPGVPPGWAAWDRRMVDKADEATYISDYCRRALFGGPDDARAALGSHAWASDLGMSMDAAASASGSVVVGAGVTPPRPASPETVQALRQALGINPDTPVLLCLQRLVAYKGIEVLIDMMGVLAQGEQPPVLLVAGSGPERDALTRRAAELGLGDRVRFLGFVPDAEMPAVWGLADLFVFHSRYETFGLAVAEAMAAGKAVVAARTTAIPEVVRDGVDGLLVPPDDPAAFARAVAALLLDRPRRAALGAAGHERALACFSWDLVAERYRAVVERAARRG